MKKSKVGLPLCRAGDPGVHRSSVFIAWLCFSLCFLHSTYFFLEAPSLHLTKLATPLSAIDRNLEKNQHLMEEKDTLLIFQNVNSFLK